MSRTITPIGKKMTIPEYVLTWLLEESNPSVRYRTLTELLDTKEDQPEVIETCKRIPGSKPVQRILSQIQENGEWPWSGSYDSPELGIGYLGELGMSQRDPLADRAVQAYLSKQYEDGSFPKSYSLRPVSVRPERNDESCYYALTLRGLVRMGYKADPRVQQAIAFARSESRWDGGYLCTKSYVKADTKSCIRGSKNTLLLFAELPELWETPECDGLVGYFLDRKVFYKRSDPTQFVRGHPQTIYPFHYRYGILEPLYALSRMGYGQHPALEDGWRFLAEVKDRSGKYILDWTMPKCAFNPGKKGSVNKWVTLYAYLALKYKNLASAAALP
jgi:hypothetical protein